METSHVKDIFTNNDLLISYYNNFWKKIYYDESYIYYKNSLFFYKNIQNSKFYSMFSVRINAKLYNKKCSIINKNDRIEFINSIGLSVENSKLINIPSSDELCELIDNIIYSLDKTFNISPLLPFPITCFRAEQRGIYDKILNLKKGDLYNSLGYISCSLNPFQSFFRNQIFYPNNTSNISKKYINIFFTIFLRKSSKGIYINIPFSHNLFDKTSIGYNEYELLLPRNCLFRIISTKKKNNIFFISMLLVYQDNLLHIKNIYPKKNSIKLIKTTLKLSNEHKVKLNYLYDLYCNIYKEYINITYKKNSNIIKKIPKLIKTNKIWLIVEPSLDKIKYNLYKNIIHIQNSKHHRNIPLLIEDERFYKKIPQKLHLLQKTMILDQIYETHNHKKCGNKYYEINKLYPLFIIVCINFRKEQEIELAKKRYMSYWDGFHVENEIKTKVTIKNISKKNIYNDYYYLDVISEEL